LYGFKHCDELIFNLTTTKKENLIIVFLIIVEF